MSEKNTDVLLEIEFQRIIMCSCPGRQRWCREAYGVHGIEGCLDPEFKNCGGQRGLSWWRKQNEQCLGGMETLQCAWRRAKSEICHCSRLRSHGIQNWNNREDPGGHSLEWQPKETALYCPGSGELYRTSEQLVSWFEVTSPYYREQK